MPARRAPHDPGRTDGPRAGMGTDHGTDVAHQTRLAGRDVGQEIKELAYIRGLRATTASRSNGPASRTL